MSTVFYGVQPAQIPNEGTLKRLSFYVPDFLLQSAVFQAVYGTQEAELDTLKGCIQGILNQAYIDTATWGLKYWEEFLGIKVDEAKPVEHRRSYIKSRLRGVGTVTVELLKNVAQSYDNGGIDVIEHNNTYSFEIKFNDIRGIPPNLSDLQKAMNEIKPAHLGVTYTFTYTAWGEVKAGIWGQIKTGTWGELKTREVI